MRSILFGLFLVVCAVVAQDDGVCECGIFIRESFGIPFPHGPIYNYPTSAVDCNSGADDVNCQFNCSVYFRYTINDIVWDDEMPGENITWGQHFCDESFDALGWTIDDPEDLRCLSTFMESRYRLEGCGGAGVEWVVAISDTRSFCCDQMGRYISGCPPDAE